MEGNSVDFNKAFDLSGRCNDEMLRLYLREAGLSDKIEYLTPEQRKAFIYDIIKSNNDPGKWKPSTMWNMSENNNITTENLKKKEENSSRIQFIKKKKKKGRQSISEPMNFQYIDGIRDMSKNAFDLTKKSDNILKKYMFEKDISEVDLENIDKEVIIKNIIQSEFKWIPKKNSQNQTAFDKPLSNFENLCYQFPSPSEFPSPESLYWNNQNEKIILENCRKQTESCSINKKPAPPPRKRNPVTIPLLNTVPKPPPPPPLLLHRLQEKPPIAEINSLKNDTNCSSAPSESLQIQKDSIHEELLTAIKKGVALKKVNTIHSASKLLNEPQIKTLLVLRYFEEPGETDV